MRIQRSFIFLLILIIAQKAISNTRVLHENETLYFIVDLLTIISINSSLESSSYFVSDRDDAKKGVIFNLMVRAKEDGAPIEALGSGGGYTISDRLIDHLTTGENGYYCESYSPRFIVHDQINAPLALYTMDDTVFFSGDGVRHVVNGLKKSVPAIADCLSEMSEGMDRN